MDNLSYIGISRQKALRELMEVTANNMANVNTPGFKAQNMLFTEFLKKSPGGGSSSQVENSGSYRDFRQGSLTQTANNLDFAIQGDGFFAVETENGVEYTRAGSFQLNSKRQIVTKLGLPVLGDTGLPMTVPNGASRITVTESGMLSSDKGSIGKLKIVKFADPKALEPAGNSLFNASKTKEEPVEKPLVVQGMLENSNVQPIIEMNKMIEILRQYQSTQNILNSDHDMMRSMIQRLTRV